MQYIIGKIAWLMQVCLNTTAAEVGRHCSYRTASTKHCCCFSQ